MTDNSKDINLDNCSLYEYVAELERINQSGHNSKLAKLSKKPSKSSYMQHVMSRKNLIIIMLIILAILFFYSSDVNNNTFVPYSASQPQNYGLERYYFN